MTRPRRKNMWLASVFFYLGISLALVRTAEALAMFGPKTIFGMTDPSIPVFWGWFAALLVEGVFAYAFEILKGRYSRGEQNMSDDPVEMASWVAAGFAVVFSIAFNTIDVGITYNWFRFDDTAPVTLMIRVVVVVLPILTAVVFGVMRVLDSRETGDSQGFPGYSGARPAMGDLQMRPRQELPRPVPPQVQGQNHQRQPVPMQARPNQPAQVRQGPPPPPPAMKDEDLPPFLGRSE